MTGQPQVNQDVDAEARSYFAETKWVRIMNDYSASGVWGKDGAAYEPSDLPLPADLQDQILAWAEEWEAEETSVGEMTNKGLAIAKAVKAELPDWTVVFFDEAKLASAPNTEDRSVFEYEIEL